jgi:hypothetical protein
MAGVSIVWSYSLSVDQWLTLYLFILGCVGCPENLLVSCSNRQFNDEYA